MLKGLFAPKGDPAPAGPSPGDRFDGNHCFSDGFFYPVPVDADGNELGPDWSTPLVWDAAEGCLRYAAPEDPNHFHTYSNGSGSVAELSPVGGGS